MSATARCSAHRGGGVATNALTIDGGSTASPAVVNLASGGAIATGSTVVGSTSGASNVFNQNGGTHSIYGNLTLATASGTSGVYNLSGGTLIAGGVNGGSGSSTFKFAGGTAEVNQNSITLFHNVGSVMVGSAGGTVNGNKFALTIAQPLLHDLSLGAALDGGMTFTGATDLTLTGASTYTGPTISDCSLNLTGGSLQDSVFNCQQGVSTIKGNITAPTALEVGYIASGTANANLQFQSGTIHTGEVDIASSGAIGELNQSGGTLNVDGNMNVGVGGFADAGASAGTATIGGNLNLAGSYELSGMANLSTQNVYVGGVAVGQMVIALNQSGGTHTISGNLYLGSAAGAGSYNLSGSGVISAAAAYVGYAAAGALTISGGSMTVSNLYLGDGGNGTLSLGLGNLHTPSVQTLGSSSTFNFNGGTVWPTQSGTANFLNVTTANVQGGGAIFNTNGYDITISQPLLHDTTAGAPATDGGLIKHGVGTLTLTGANTYRGVTTIDGGTLRISNDAALGAVPSSPSTLLDFSGSSALQLTGSAGAVTLSKQSQRADRR